MTDNAEIGKIADAAATQVIAVCKQVLEEDPTLQPVVSMQMVVLRDVGQLRTMIRALSLKQQELVHKVSMAVAEASMDALSHIQGQGGRAD